MKDIKYTVIKDDKQYDRYCKIVHDLDFAPGKKTKSINDEIELLIALIEKYDDEQRDFPLLNPVEFLVLLMKERKLKAVDLAKDLGVTKGYISQILNYKREFSKEVIRKLAKKFRVQQEAFNRPYALKGLKKKKAA
jgi:HTH-type transcriptional regulator / antitoxin HigA